MEGDAQQLSTLDGSKGIYYLLGWNFTTQVRKDGAAARVHNAAVQPYATCAAALLSLQVPNLISIDINSGTVLHDVPLPFVEGGFVGVGQQIAFDSVSGERNAPAHQHPPARMAWCIMQRLSAVVTCCASAPCPPPLPLQAA